MDKAKIEENNLKKLKTLFKGLKFFLNREVPREQFAFVIRCFSGNVSWDKDVAVGSTYQEDDPTITHHIVDRPIVNKTYLNRIYVQPQWVFDCVNENMLLPVDDYLPGATLPPHLSPFVDIQEGDYVPPEKQRLIKLKLGITDTEENKEGNDDEDDESEEENEKEEEKDEKVKTNGKAKTENGTKKQENSEDENEEDDDEDEEDDSLVSSEDDEEEEEVKPKKKENAKSKNDANVSNGKHEKSTADPVI